MGQLRNALRALALDGHSPGALLERLDRLVRLDGEGMATVVCATLSPRLDSMVLASAGHPPPLLVDTSGGTTFVEGHTTMPLGCLERQHGEGRVDLAPGSRLLLYTDGLVEDRGELDRRRARVAAHRGRRRAGRPGGAGGGDPRGAGPRGRRPEDDVTLLVCSTAPAAPRPLSLVLPADPTALRGMRIRLGRWLEELGAEPAEMRDIQLASHEACCNAMEHGYEFGDKTLELAASRSDGGVRIVVTDEGRWREPHGPNGTRGRGIDVMRELMGEVDVARSDGGTRVEMSRSLTTPPPPP